MSTSPSIRFVVIGGNHAHIYSQVRLMLNAGAKLVSFYAAKPELAAAFTQRFPQAGLLREPPLTCAPAAASCPGLITASHRAG